MHERLDSFHYTPGKGRQFWMDLFTGLAARLGARLHHRERFTKPPIPSAELERMARFLFRDELRVYRRHGDAVISARSRRLIARPRSLVRHHYVSKESGFRMQVDFARGNVIPYYGVSTWLSDVLHLVAGEVWACAMTRSDLDVVASGIAAHHPSAYRPLRRKCWSCGRRYEATLESTHCPRCKPRAS